MIYACFNYVLSIFNIKGRHVSKMQSHFTRSLSEIIVVWLIIHYAGRIMVLIEDKSNVVVDIITDFICK